MAPPSLMIVGPQGSGKTTQAELLSKTFGFSLISAGDMLREVARENTPLGRKVRQTVNVEGRLVEPHLVTELIKEKIQAVPKDRGLVLDGYPRTLTQYELFKQFWPQTGRGDYHVIFIDMPPEEAVSRLMKRVKRPDDTPAAIQTRLQSFYAETMPMIRAIEADGKVLHVNGARGIEEVHQNIIANLSDLYPDLIR